MTDFCQNFLDSLNYSYSGGHCFPFSIRFIAAGPDQRRSESVGPDGITRGSYSYLDDKGIQRTVQYIAGAGIGYRVVQTITGSGTHNLPRPTAPQFGVFTQQSNDLPPESLYFDDTPTGFGKGTSSSSSPGTSTLTNEGNQGSSKVNSGSWSSRGGKTPTYDENDVRVSTSGRKPSLSKGPSQHGFRRPFDGPDPNAIIPEITASRPPTPTPPSPPQRTHHHRRPQYPYNTDLRPTAPPRSYPDYFSVNSIDFDKANIRAHVQNIDLLPVSPRYPSPGDALKWDIIAGN